MRQSQIDENCQLDNGNQNDRKRNALFYDHDDHKNRDNRYQVDGREINRRYVDQIICARRLADKQSVFVVRFDDLVQLLNLSVHFIGSGGVFRAEDHHLPAIALEDALHGIGQHFFGHHAADNTVKTERELYAVRVLELLAHLADFLLVQIRINKYHMSIAHTEFVLELCVGDDVCHILRQAL